MQQNPPNWNVPPTPYQPPPPNLPPRPDRAYLFSEPRRFFSSLSMSIVLIIWCALIAYFPLYAGLQGTAATVMLVLAGFGIGFPITRLIRAASAWLKSQGVTAAPSFGLCMNIIFALVSLIIFFHGLSAKQSGTTLLVYQSVVLVCIMIITFLMVYSLHFIKVDKAQIEVLRKNITIKGVVSALIAIIGAITVLVPFIQLIVSLPTGKK